MLPPFMSPDFTVGVNYSPSSTFSSKLMKYRGEQFVDSYTENLQNKTINFNDGGLTIGNYYYDFSDRYFKEYRTQTETYSNLRRGFLFENNGSSFMVGNSSIPYDTGDEYLDLVYRSLESDYFHNGIQYFLTNEVASIYVDGKEITDVAFGSKSKIDISNYSKIDISYVYITYETYEIKSYYKNLFFTNCAIQISKFVNSKDNSTKYSYYIGSTYSYTQCCITQCCNPNTYKMIGD